MNKANCKLLQEAKEVPYNRIIEECQIHCSVNSKRQVKSQLRYSSGVFVSFSLQSAFLKPQDTMPLLKCRFTIHYVLLLCDDLLNDQYLYYSFDRHHHISMGQLTLLHYYPVSFFLLKSDKTSGLVFTIVTCNIHLGAYVPSCGPHAQMDYIFMPHSVALVPATE